MFKLNNITFLYYFPINNLPQLLQMCGPPILIIQIVGVLPDVEGEDRL